MADDLEWLKLACGEIELEGKLRELRQAPNDSLCKIVRSNHTLFSLYWDDFDNEVLPRASYERMHEHIGRCYPCNESYKSYVDDMPASMRYARDQTWTKYAEKKISEFEEKLRQDS